MSNAFKYIIDSYAWIEYLEGTEQGKILRDILEDESNDVYTPSIIASEVLSKARRMGNTSALEFAEKTLEEIPKIIDIDYGIAKRAAEIHANERKSQKDFGLADAILIACAEKIGAKIVTGDRHFKEMKDVVFIE